ncbi:MAG: SDR family NAD(P)-dependent oxidoreductase [Nitrososphaerota archaeon]|nr:SDR family NAD(P)-dependent oxidoreductase [Nitrososphaerota archaeon]
MAQFGRALVTGGAGFIGSHIADLLVQQGHEVVVLDDLSAGDFSNLKEASSSKNFTFLKGDINDPDTAKKAIKDVEVVFHEAALVSVPKSIKEPELTSQINVEGTRNLLRYTSDSSVDRFVFASSAAVYGDCKDLPLKTTSPTNPISPYGRSKLEAERYCLDSHESSGLGTTILRYFNVNGPRSLTGEYGSVVNKFMERIVSRKAPMITGDGSSTRDFIYVKDVARANLLAASSENSKGRIYNIASGIPTTMDELARLELEILFGPNQAIPFEYVPRADSDILHSLADISSSRDELGFETSYSLMEGLEEYLKMLWPNLPIISEP